MAKFAERLIQVGFDVELLKFQGELTFLGARYVAGTRNDRSRLYVTDSDAIRIFTGRGGSK